MVARLERRTGGLPVVATARPRSPACGRSTSTASGSSRPPWFDAELTELGGAYFRDQGFDVVGAATCGLPSDQRSVTPEGLHDWVAEHAPGDAQGVVVGGNGFRAVGAIEALEADARPAGGHGEPGAALARPRCRTESPARVAGYGRLFDRTPRRELTPGGPGGAERRRARDAVPASARSRGSAWPASGAA